MSAGSQRPNWLATAYTLFTVSRRMASQCSMCEHQSLELHSCLISSLRSVPLLTTHFPVSSHRTYILCVILQENLFSFDHLLAVLKTCSSSSFYLLSVPQDSQVDTDIGTRAFAVAPPTVWNMLLVLNQLKILQNSAVI